MFTAHACTLTLLCIVSTFYAYFHADTFMENFDKVGGGDPGAGVPTAAGAVLVDRRAPARWSFLGCARRCGGVVSGRRQREQHHTHKCRR